MKGNDCAHKFDGLECVRCGRVFTLAEKADYFMGWSEGRILGTSRLDDPQEARLRAGGSVMLTKGKPERPLHNGDMTRRHWDTGEWGCGKVNCSRCEAAWNEHVRLGHTFDRWTMKWKEFVNVTT